MNLVTSDFFSFRHNGRLASTRSFSTLCANALFSNNFDVPLSCGKIDTIKTRELTTSYSRRLGSLSAHDVQFERSEATKHKERNETEIVVDVVRLANHSKFFSRDFSRLDLQVVVCESKVEVSLDHFYDVRTTRSSAWSQDSFFLLWTTRPRNSFQQYTGVSVASHRCSPFHQLGCAKIASPSQSSRLSFFSRSWLTIAYEWAAQLGRLRVSVLGGKENWLYND